MWGNLFTAPREPPRNSCCCVPEVSDAFEGLIFNLFSLDQQTKTVIKRG